MTDAPDDIVGHKTFSTGERDEDGFPKHRHEPLTRAEADAMMNIADQQKQKRAENMPDEQSAIEAMFQAHYRLRELGWKEVIYSPKDGSPFKVIEAGSTGIHHCHYSGTWPDGMWNIEADGDLWPSRPILYRLYPEDEAKEKERWAEFRRKYREENPG